MSVSRRTHGFTLIELLVVIAIIAILAAILFPVFAQAREKARQTSCLSNMKQIMTAVKSYTQDYDEMTPDFPIRALPGDFWQPYEELIFPYIKSKDVFICPSAETDPDAYMQDSFGDTGYTAAGMKVVSTYYWDLNQYGYWNTPGVPGVTSAFFGSPLPMNDRDNVAQVIGATNVNLCTTYDYFLCVSAEMAERPAEVKFLEEGFVVADPVAGTQFGNVYGLGGAFEPGNQSKRLYSRHAEGQNIAFADGHVKYNKGSKIFSDYSARTGGRYAGYPQSPIMRVGP